MNLQQNKQAGSKSNIGLRVVDGRVVDNKDPEGLCRVRVEILGKTDETDKDNLPWLETMGPLGLGGSGYTSDFGIPQINTQVKVLFADDSMQSGLVIGSCRNRASIPNDPVKITKGYKHPKTSEHTYSEVWDSQNEQQDSFNSDLTEDYPYTHGWVDNAKNWFKVNMLKRCFEFVANSLLRLKSYANGDTVLYIPGHLKIIIEKDVQIEVRGNVDKTIFGNKNEHVLGERVTQIEGNETRTSGKNIYDSASPNIYEN